jgi:hypothetical protein
MSEMLKEKKRTIKSYYAKYESAMNVSQATFYRQLGAYMKAQKSGAKYERKLRGPAVAVDETLLDEFESHLLNAQTHRPLTVGSTGREWVKFVADMDVSDERRQFFIANAGGNHFCYMVLNRMRNSGKLLSERQNVTELARRVQLQPERTASYIRLLLHELSRCSMHSLALKDPDAFAGKGWALNSGLVAQENGSEDASGLMTVNSNGDLLFVPTMEPFFPISKKWLLCYDESPWEAVPRSGDVVEVIPSSAGWTLAFATSATDVLYQVLLIISGSAKVRSSVQAAIHECLEDPLLHEAASIIVVTANKPSFTNAQIFAEHTAQWTRDVQAPALLSMDGATAHLDHRATATLAKAGIYPIIEPSGTSQSHQANDLGINAFLKRLYKKFYSEFQLFDAGKSGGRISDAQRVRMTIKAVAEAIKHPEQWNGAWKRLGWTEDGRLDVIQAYPASFFRVGNGNRDDSLPVVTQSYVSSLFSWRNLSQRPGSPHEARTAPSTRHVAMPRVNASASKGPMVRVVLERDETLNPDTKRKVRSLLLKSGANKLQRVEQVNCIQQALDDDDNCVDDDDGQAASSSWVPSVKPKPYDTQDGMLIMSKDLQGRMATAQAAKKAATLSKEAKVHNRAARAEQESDVIDLISATMDPDTGKALWKPSGRSPMPTIASLKRYLVLHKAKFKSSASRPDLVQIVRQQSGSGQNTQI